MRYTLDLPVNDECRDQPDEIHRSNEKKEVLISTSTGVGIGDNACVRLRNKVDDVIIGDGLHLAGCRGDAIFAKFPHLWDWDADGNYIGAAPLENGYTDH